MLLDTNVLVGGFASSTSSQRDEIRYFLDEYDAQWLVLVGVIVEAWGMLVGRDRDLAGGYELLAWLNTPGKATIISQRGDDSPRINSLVRELRVDVVDALLMSTATEITEQCGLRPWLPVATYDTRDFLRLFKNERLRLCLYDMNSDQQYDPEEYA